jgi:hypothetical protein
MSRVIIIQKRESSYLFKLMDAAVKNQLQTHEAPHEACGISDGGVKWPGAIIAEWGMRFEDIMYLAEWCDDTRANPRLKGLIYKID